MEDHGVFLLQARSQGGLEQNLSLLKIILNFEKQSLNYKSLYKNYTKKKVMNDFQNIFFKKKQLYKFTLNKKIWIL